MAYDHKSFLKGLAAGLVSKGRLPKGEQKEPVDYLYNGVRLPKLPEWDESVYPYVYLTKNIIGGIQADYFFTFSATPVYWDTKAPAYGYALWATGRLFHANVYVTEDKTEIEVMGETDEDPIHADGIWEIIWTNTDILNTDGETIWLEASEPIPVYE